MTTPAFGSLGEAFLYCRDMDASLSERLDAFSSATRYLNPGYQEAVDRLVSRLKAYDAGQAVPKPGEPMPPFAMPDEQGHLVTLDALLAGGPPGNNFPPRPLVPLLPYQHRCLCRSAGTHCL